MFSVTITVVQEGEEPYTIGTVQPPTVNRRIPTVKEGEIGPVLNRLWREWRKANPHPDTDEEFVDWLCAEKGWKSVDTPLIHVIEV